MTDNNIGTEAPKSAGSNDTGPNDPSRNRFANRNRRNNRGRRNNNAGPRKQDGGSSNFEGRDPALKGYIYDYTGEYNPDQYIKTTDEIVTNVGRTYVKYKGDFTEAIKVLELNDLEEPAHRWTFMTSLPWKGGNFISRNTGSR